MATKTQLAGILLATTALVALTGCEKKIYDMPVFDDFQYVGLDDRYPSVNPRTQYLNPIISGCYPDPSICRKGNDYYLANSTFVYYPGIPIWHSTDLVHWRLLNYALDRPSQLMLKDDLRISAGIFAPDIKYNPLNDTFYLIVTGVGCGGNFVVKTQDPAQGWSDPIGIPEVGGIDPSFLFDTDGKAYIVNNDAPAYPAEYDGHRAIWVREYDTQTDKVVGEAKVLVDKGVHPEDKPIWIEGPHLYHIGSTYYLMCAEGGTADDHSEVIFTSRSPWGPFTPCKVNPILTQRTLAKDRVNPITSTGHADLFQAADSTWWAVFLGILPYEGDQYCNTGRSTFLLPVKWEGNQPIILDDGLEVPTVVNKASLDAEAPQTFLTGKGSYVDHFDGKDLDLSWIYLRTPIEQWHELKDGHLVLTPRPVNLSELKQPSMVCRWIKNIQFEAQTTLLYTPRSSKDFAGLTCFQKEDAYYAIGKTCDAEGDEVVTLIRQDKDTFQYVASQKLTSSVTDRPLQLKVEAKGSYYTFSYSTNDGKQWTQLAPQQDGHILSTTYSGGFTGAVVGLYATSANK